MGSDTDLSSTKINVKYSRTMSGLTSIFPDGTRISHQEEVKYSGCSLNISGDCRREVQSRISACTAITRRLELFWKQAEVPVKWKVIVYDAVIKSAFTTYLSKCCNVANMFSSSVCSSMLADCSAVLDVVFKYPPL